MMTEFERKTDRKLILSIIAAGIMSFSGVVTENRYSCVNLSPQGYLFFLYLYFLQSLRPAFLLRFSSTGHPALRSQHGSQKRHQSLAFRMLKQLRRIALFHDLSIGHKHDTIRHFLGKSHLVSHNDHGGMLFR